jgi:hypothetical protein
MAGSELQVLPVGDNGVDGGEAHVSGVQRDGEGMGTEVNDPMAKARGF